MAEKPKKHWKITMPSGRLNRRPAIVCIEAHTKSEARAAAKKVFGLKRLPFGAQITLTDIE